METSTIAPGANRLHIGIFGETNSGKSSFINAFTGQDVSIVSAQRGTTTDPVIKAMEVPGLGACTLVDTAGFNDESVLGTMRLRQSMKAAEKCDLAVIIIEESQADISQKILELINLFNEQKVGILFVINCFEDIKKCQVLEENLRARFSASNEYVIVNCKTGQNIDTARQALARLVPEDFDSGFITGNLVEPNDLVLLVMPQDIQAPKGRLILAQVQTLRELLDRKCLVCSVTCDGLDAMLSSLVNPPKLIITDSQAFDYVYSKKPKESMLTSFSVLMAAYKGDLPYYMEGAKVIDNLTPESRVLIAECCTHAPMEEDIGRVKIPRMLKNRIGQELQVEICQGTNFPEDLSTYDLIIQCGACMFNKKYVRTRIDKAKAQGVPMTNYGITIAHVTGILDKIVFGESIC